MQTVHTCGEVFARLPCMRATELPVIPCWAEGLWAEPDFPSPVEAKFKEGTGISHTFPTTQVPRGQAVQPLFYWGQKQVLRSGGSLCPKTQKNA